MKKRYQIILIVCIIVCLISLFTMFNGRRQAIHCSSTINQEVVLLAEFGAMKNSLGLAKRMGVFSFKIGDVLYGIGHLTGLNKYEEYEVYKTNPVFDERTEESFGGILYRYKPNEELLGKVICDTDTGIIVSCDNIDKEKYQTISIADEIVSGKAEILIRDEEGILQTYSATIEVIEEMGKERLDITITDERLTTGGILTGMSGSPIVQDGKLVGVLSHAYVNKPYEGKGQIIWNIDCLQEYLKIH